MAKLLRPIILFLHVRGIDLSYYVDDGITVQSSYVKCKAAHELTLFVLQNAGWEIALDKCTEKPCQTILYLGFYLCSKSMRIYAPQVKIDRLINAINTVFMDNNNMGSVPCKQLAQCLGVICHLLQSHGDILRIASRLTQHYLGLAVQSNGWNGQVIITEEMVRELKLCQEYLIR